MITSAFTCTGPYAILIMLGIKRVENRSVMPVPGKVVGCCDYEATSGLGATLNGRDARSTKWDEGYDFLWELSNVVCFDRPIPCRGNVGMWQMPPALAAQVTATDALVRSVGEVVSLKSAGYRSVCEGS